MKIRKGNDGRVWLFSDSVGGWLEFESAADTDAGEVLSQLVKNEMVERPALSFNEAFSEIQGKHPNIARRCLEQIREKRR